MQHPLAGVRVIETGDATIDYCGLILAGLGAEVVKVEGLGGAEGRRIGPFCAREGHEDESLFFWAYNRGKSSVALDFSSPSDRDRLVDLVSGADVWIDAGRPKVDTAYGGLDIHGLRDRYPRLIAARLTPFGEDGPWSGFKGGDLVQLALGGVLMNCGYDPGIDGTYDTPPIWPQAFQSLHIAGEQLSMAVIAALFWRAKSGQGQMLTCAIHEAVAKCTEVDLMSWVMLRTPFSRQTCRHSAPSPSAPTIAQTKDGRWVNAMTLSGGFGRNKLRDFLATFGIGASTDEPTTKETDSENRPRRVPGVGDQLSEDTQRDIELVQRLTRRTLFESVPWKEAQEAGLLWAPIRKPHENALDDHWLHRGTFADVVHTDLGSAFRYPVSKWVSSSSPWRAGNAAPRLGEHADVIGAWRLGDTETPRVSVGPSTSANADTGRRQWALDGVRVLDFSWFLASAGGTRFLSAMGADCIKVEWVAHPDTRLGAGAPVGGRAERDQAVKPLMPTADPDMGGNFNHKNAGKRGISLNVLHPEGLRIVKELIKQSDVIAEGFSPGVLDRWGLGYDVLQTLRPDIIYAQQSGMGVAGTYGRTRAVGPIAAALSGVSEMSGLPDPAAPAGWGYSYLDWLAAYSFASAILAALFERERTGQGQHIDASQCEVGIFASALAVLDWSANGTIWSRTGNRSPYEPAAPEGVYPCEGTDRWLALSCKSDDEWQCLARVIGGVDLASDDRFRTLADRLIRRDELDEVVRQWTSGRDRYAAMVELQGAGVPAGVCQNAEDRCDSDEQLRYLEWLTEVTGTKIGTWPVGEVAVRMDLTPPYIGGKIDRGAPCYGEDNYSVYGELLGLSNREIDQLKIDGVI
jgi:crotonobetainyl-CoA:carnitine CoA-transferase CaiB-like acyl-CoA transferase